ncbi:hypothetical protein DM47_3669 [Burkholderia mallei]|nr:hypothetical protein DP44_5935 [Burkholderia pseudomallei]KOS76768.1 hypothetical protein DM46_2933 [Burkholderia mallei]KOS95639.1 hypothetical protein DM45_4035 [Burkholderia mallei]KOS97813.1 hypothetical protein DM49_4154 [Burkholderia mallei]KOT02116.1 hypothetical protein DM50_3931 [Burkholderia mallei]
MNVARRERRRRSANSKASSFRGEPGYGTTTPECFSIDSGAFTLRLPFAQNIGRRATESHAARNN